MSRAPDSCMPKPLESGTFSLFGAVTKHVGQRSATASIAIIFLIILLSTSAAISVIYASVQVLFPDVVQSPFIFVLGSTIIITVAVAPPVIVYCVLLVRHLLTAKQEQHEAAQAALAASSAKSFFLSNMSHEIRTPLNGVLGMADALAQEPLPPHQAEYVSIIRESSKSLLGIVNDVLDLSKMQAGNFVCAPVEANFYHVFESATKMYRAAANEKSIKLFIHVDKSVPQQLCFDTVRVRQCVFNILSNAIKFTEKGEIRVSARGEGTETGQLRIVIDVEDTGIGISPEMLATLFTDFHQADNSTSRRFGGTGLGLSIARRLARLMGGDVTATSIENRGSRFTFSFVSSSPASEAPAVKTDETVPWLGTLTLLGSSRVLLVDDNVMNRKVIQMLLKPAKMSIIEAENGRQALDAMEKEHFDLVLLDVHMPIMDGIEAMRRIRASTSPWREIAVIALTADVLDATQHRLKELGVDGIAHKPVDQRSLVSEIVRVLSLKPPRSLVRGEARKPAEPSTPSPDMAIPATLPASAGGDMR
jgi:signal transduction histidine kinase/DNA-binding NarL/FixJ family response regulator